KLDVQQLRQRAGYFDASCSTAHDAERQRPFLDERGILVNGLKGFKDVLLEQKRILHGVERERMFGRTRRTKEIDHRPQSQNQVIVTDGLNAFRYNLLSGQIDAADHGLMESNVFSGVKKFADGKTDFSWRQLVSRHLVDQRLKGVIVMFVDYREIYIGVSQAFERADTTEPGTQNHYMR